MTHCKSLLLKLFRMLTKPFLGTGIGRFKIIGNIYRYTTERIIQSHSEPIVINNYKMFLHTERYDAISHELLISGAYESYDTELFKQFTKKGMALVDIGANIGYFTLLASSLVGEKGKVFAFEPEPKNYSLLLKNIEINGFKNVVPLQEAVSNETGKLHLFVDKAESGGHSLFKSAAERGLIDSSSCILVDVVSLDEFFRELNFSVDIIKIDIQGAEPLALMGMRDTIKSNDVVKYFTEFWPYGLEKAGFSGKQYWDLIRQMGLNHIYLINEKKRILEEGDFQEIMDFCTNFREPRHVNLLCSKYVIFI